MKQVILFLLSFIILNLGCNKSGTEPEYRSDGFVPLAVGNYWKYKILMGAGAEKDNNYNITIKGIDYLTSGLKVFKMDAVGVDPGQRDLFYWHQSDTSFIEFWNKNFEEGTILIKYPLSIGLLWETQGSTFSVISKDTLTVEAGVFDDCWKIKMDSDLIKYFYWKEGLGLIKVHGELHQNPTPTPFELIGVILFLVEII